MQPQGTPDVEITNIEHEMRRKYMYIDNGNFHNNLAMFPCTLWLIAELQREQKDSG